MNRVCRWSVVLVTFAVAVMAAQSHADSIAPEPKSSQNKVGQAVTKMEPKSNSKVNGAITFTKVKEGVRVVAKIEGLTPGSHGFHIHDVGDCSAPDASSAGGHFNPHKMPHAGPDAAQRHAGDLGNIEANAQGNATYDRVDHHLSLEGDETIIGRSVIIHEKTDDLKSQPTGDAGGRVACGVIRAD